MSRTTAVKQYNTFVKGLITEASPLTYPENASLAEDNFVLKRNGSRERRLGIDYEAGYGLTPTSLSSNIISGTKSSYHSWNNPGGSTRVSIGVVRIYNKLWFLNSNTSAPSNNLLNQGNSITIDGLANADIATTVVNNYLVIVSKDLDKPIVLSYSEDDDLVRQTEIPIQIRDLFGVVDNLSISERPTTLSKTHEYNLINQGWIKTIQTICDAGDTSGHRRTFWQRSIGTLSAVTTDSSTSNTDPSKKLQRWRVIGDNTNPANPTSSVPTYSAVKAIECTYTTIGKYPSNADIWTLGKVSNASSANYEKYDPNVLVKNAIDNMEAAKGGFIIDAFSRGLSRRTLFGNDSLPLDNEFGRFTTVATYAGRVFYSGINSSVQSGDGKSPNYSNYIFFSQVVTDTDKLGKCYQEADPTSPNISDIVDTDGGTIQIPEATKIVKLLSTRNSLLVFAENGIWEVFGDTNGFVATSYQVSKLSSTGCSSPNSVVEAIGSVFAWTKVGIYVLTPDPTTQKFTPENLSLLYIQTLYNNLSEICKDNARVLFNERENTVRWLYNDSETYTGESIYNRELVLDLTLKAFYTNTISSSTPYVVDYIELPNYTLSYSIDDVYVGTDPVYVGTDQVQASKDIYIPRVAQFSFLTLVDTSFTVSKYNNSTFYDWKIYTGSGINYTSYLLTGYDVLGDIVRQKQVIYVWFYFTQTEDGFTLLGSELNIDNPSSCLVQAQWDWTNSVASGKWSDVFQAYRLIRPYIPTGPDDTFDNGYAVVVTRNKLRGSGKCLSLLISSEEGKDMKLLGWALVGGAGVVP